MGKTVRNNRKTNPRRKVKQMASKPVVKKREKEEIEPIDKDENIVLNKNLEISEEDLLLFQSLESSYRPQLPKKNSSIHKQIIKNEKQELLSDPSKDPKVKAVYNRIGEILSKYTSGKLPRSIHILPSLQNWKSLLELTNVENWSPHSFYEITRIFVSKTESDRTIDFYKDYLLPRVLKDIREKKKLNYHLFRALQKGLYRPASWFRGILFSFAEKNDNTLKQSQIIASVIMKTSIPNSHASTAIYWMTDKQYNGPNNIIIKILIEKKFSLPKVVIDKISNWFLTFKEFKNILPVLWYQTLLSFCKLYRKHLDNNTIQLLRKLIKEKKHIMTKEILIFLNDN